MTSRWLAVGFAVSLMAFGVAASAQAKGRPAARDVLFFVVDDMNDWISLLDPNAPIQTPNLERLASRGMLFTRAYCASAAFMVFVAGDKRIVEPTAYIMTHELWTLAFLKLETPTSKEHEAKTMRMFQDTINEWLASRSGVSKKKLDEMVQHKDWWMSGKDAVTKWKFADGYIE